MPCLHPQAVRNSYALVLCDLAVVVVSHVPHSHCPSCLIQWGLFMATLFLLPPQAVCDGYALALCDLAVLVSHVS